MFRSALLALCAGLLLGACGNNQQKAADQDQAGREETRNIRNTKAIGYSGDNIADKVDAALDANDKRNQQLREAEDY